MPRHFEHCSCDTLSKYAHDVGHGELLFALRKHASCASSVVHGSVKVERVTQHVSVYGDRHDSAPVESAAVRAPARLKRRCGVAACTFRAAK